MALNNFVVTSSGYQQLYLTWGGSSSGISGASVYTLYSSISGGTNWVSGAAIASGQVSYTLNNLAFGTLYALELSGNGLTSNVCSGQTSGRNFLFDNPPFTGLYPTLIISGWNGCQVLTGVIVTDNSPTYQAEI